VKAMTAMAALLLLTGVTACEPGAGSPLAGRVEDPAVTGDPASEAPAEAAAVRTSTSPPPPPPGGSVCNRMARRFWEFAERHPQDAAAFMDAVQDEFVGGTDDPFELKRGLQEGEWNQEYFYAGHGGFRAEFDDAQRYPNGGNHQPGHYVSVLTIAFRFGEEQAVVGMAVAGDFQPGEEDDYRLSRRAIEDGTALSAGEVGPHDVGVRVRDLCR
jgi:hypothetical protein